MVTSRGPDVIIAAPFVPAVLFAIVQLFTVNSSGQLYNAPPHSLVVLFSNMQSSTVVVE
ncbi:hypothetical protein [Methanobrevibacter smithii]|uniref:hypothetical protein n=1 Tax=Methanobrevibacter smithii TaxID=2173 RepID=UPI00385022D7